MVRRAMYSCIATRVRHRAEYSPGDVVEYAKYCMAISLTHAFYIEGQQHRNERLLSQRSRAEACLAALRFRITVALFRRQPGGPQNDTRQSNRTPKAVMECSNHLHQCPFRAVASARASLPQRVCARFSYRHFQRVPMSLRKRFYRAHRIHARTHRLLVCPSGSWRHWVNRGP